MLILIPTVYMFTIHKSLLVKASPSKFHNAELCVLKAPQHPMCVLIELLILEPLYLASRSNIT